VANKVTAEFNIKSNAKQEIPPILTLEQKQAEAMSKLALAMSLMGKSMDYVSKQAAGGMRDITRITNAAAKFTAATRFGDLQEQMAGVTGALFAMGSKDAQDGLHNLSRGLGNITQSARHFLVTGKMLTQVLANIGGNLMANSDLLRMQAMSSAGLITSFAPAGDTRSQFESAYLYSEKLVEKFVEWNALTIANLDQMINVNRELNKQGVVIDMNNEAQKEAFVTITNAIGVLTAGLPNQNMQYAQEMRNVLEGVARQGSTVALVLKSKLGPSWKEQVQQWKVGGVFLEKMAEQFKGFKGQADVFKNSWEGATSTFVTNIKYIFAKGFKPVYEAVTERLVGFNDFITDKMPELIIQMQQAFYTFSVMIKNINLEQIIEISKKLLWVLGSIFLLFNAQNLGYVVQGVYLLIKALVALTASFMGASTAAATAGRSISLLFGAPGIALVAVSLLIPGLFKLFNTFKDVKTETLKNTTAMDDYKTAMEKAKKASSDLAKTKIIETAIFERHRKIQENANKIDQLEKIRARLDKPIVGIDVAKSRSELSDLGIEMLLPNEPSLAHPIERWDYQLLLMKYARQGLKDVRAESAKYSEELVKFEKELADMIETPEAIIKKQLAQQKADKIADLEADITEQTKFSEYLRSLVGTDKETEKTYSDLIQSEQKLKELRDELTAVQNDKPYTKGLIAEYEADRAAELAKIQGEIDFTIRRIALLAKNNDMTSEEIDEVDDLLKKLNKLKLKKDKAYRLPFTERMAMFGKDVAFNATDKFAEGLGFLDFEGQETSRKQFEDAKSQLEEDLAQRNITVREYNKQMAELQKDFNEEQKKYALSFENIWASAAKAMADAFKEAIRDIVQTMIKDFIKNQVINFLLQFIPGYSQAKAVSSYWEATKSATPPPGAGNGGHYSMKYPVPQKAEGDFNLSKDMLAQLHEGEMVVPKKFAQAVREGKLTIGSDSQSLELVSSKLDTLIQVSAQNKYAIIDESGLSSVTRAINNQNFRNMRYGLA
jgi:hypothetical protein